MRPPAPAPLKRQALLLAAAVITMTTGYLPWAHREDSFGAWSYDGSAWLMSIRWTLSILLTVAAAGFWLVWRAVRGGRPRAVWVAALAVVALACGATLTQRPDIPVRRTSPASAEVTTNVAIYGSGTRPPFRTPFTMLADNLRYGDQMDVDSLFPELYQDGLHVTWGYWTGLAAMLLTGVAVAALPPPRRRSR